MKTDKKRRQQRYDHRLRELLRHTGDPDCVTHLGVLRSTAISCPRSMHAVIDNFSRRILAWRVCEKFEFTTTVAILKKAALNAVSAKEVPTVVVDAGVENLNASVDELIESGWLRRVVALKDITFSNSMIEAWWRTLKHQWLYLNTLDSAQAVQ